MDLQQTILHLGGTRFLAMTGARLSSDGASLTIKLPIGRASAVVVGLEDDLYTLQAYRGRGLNMRPQGDTVRGVYAEDLAAAFTRLTGLETRL